jgi:hypothetical protein
MEIGGFNSNEMDAYSIRNSAKRPTEKEMEKMDSKMSEDLANSLIEEKDENGNGVLSAEELGLSEDAFAALETESGTYATADELANYIKTRIGEKMEERKPPEGEEPPQGPPPENGGGGPSGMISEILGEMGLSDEDSETVMQLLQSSSVNFEV